LVTGRGLTVDQATA